MTTHSAILVDLAIVVAATLTGHYWLLILLVGTSAYYVPKSGQ